MQLEIYPVIHDENELFICLKIVSVSFSGQNFDIIITVWFLAADFCSTACEFLH